MKVFDKVLYFFSPKPANFSKVRPVSKMAFFAILALVLYSFLFKVYPIGSGFWWAGDQIRDWTIARRGIFSLPMHGTVRVDGSLGPIFYWVLGLINLIIGPFFDGLPHAGGYGIALLVALGEGALVYSLFAAGFHRLLVLSLALVFASAPYPSALAGTIWNPPVSIAFTLFALSVCLYPVHYFSIRRFAVVFALGLFALQAHTPTLFLVFGIWLIAALRYMQTQSSSWLRLFKTFLITAFLLELPYLIYVWRYGSRDWATGSSAFGKSASGFSHFSMEAFSKALTKLLTLLKELFIFEIGTQFFLIATGFSVLIMLTRSKFRAETFWLVFLPIMLGAIAPILSTSPAMEAYWYISLGGGLFLLFVLVNQDFFAALGPIPGYALGTLALLTAISLQPVRWRERKTNTVMSSYAVMVKGARALKTQHPTLSKVIDPPMEEKSCAQCLYVILGGVIDPKVSAIGRIAADGSISIE